MQIKLTGASDWHLRKHVATIPPSDIICIAGDMMDLMDEAGYTRWLLQLPAPIVLVIPGNHDVPLPDDWQPEGQSKVINPARATYHAYGLRWGGFVWNNCANCPDMEWVFARSTPGQEFLLARVGEIPPCDVLLSHSPPICDISKASDGSEMGIPGLYEWAEDNKCHTIICGHVHESAGKEIQRGNVRIINAANTAISAEI